MLYKGDCIESGSQINIAETWMQTEIHRKQVSFFRTHNCFFLQQFEVISEPGKRKFGRKSGQKKVLKMRNIFTTYG